MNIRRIHDGGAAGLQPWIARWIGFDENGDFYDQRWQQIPNEDPLPTDQEVVLTPTLGSFTGGTVPNLHLRFQPFWDDLLRLHPGVEVLNPFAGNDLWDGEEPLPLIP